MTDLKLPIEKAIRTTALHLHRLKQLGIGTVQDFLSYFPRTYTDQREIRSILEIQIGEINTISATLRSLHTSSAWRRKMSITTALLSDESSSIEAVWFNQPYLAKTLKIGMQIILSGKAKYDSRKNRIYLNNPSHELIKPDLIHSGRLVPIYHETELQTTKKTPGKISSKWIREKLFPLMPFADFFQEFLPEQITKKYALIPLSQAIHNVHFPESEKKLAEAKHRLAFDELFLLSLAALRRKHLWREMAKNKEKIVAPNWDLIKQFTNSLPWPLTQAQKKAIYEICRDLEKPYPMSRLLEGDTGSGKTVVAAAASLHVIKAGFQSFLLAPTEILARQHHKNLSKLLESFGILPALLIGATEKQEKKSILEKLKNGGIQMVIGTHTLIQEGVQFKNLGLAVVDEQHRFGVKQREIVKSYESPHVLSLSATPIPRTLALILYGDQNLSLLDEMPSNRKPVLTRVVPEEKRQEAYQWIKREIEKGKQAFFIFPLIRESETLEIKAAVKEFDKLREEIFPDLRIGLLHGQMPSKEKNESMQAFVEGRTQILVSTAVVEVGVDVPNATIMLIEGAERFGLAQLHQFRGRVGRGSSKSFCFLFPTSNNPENFKRLNALVKCSSGFKLAEMDLILRGPGEVYGTAQSGIPDLKMASLSDSATIKQAREAAEILLNEEPDLNNYKILLEKISEQENIAVDY